MEWRCCDIGLLFLNRYHAVYIDHADLPRISCLTISLSLTLIPTPVKLYAMSASSKNNAQDSVQHSDPIPITSAHSHRRAASDTSSESSGSPSSPPMPQTPMSAGRTSPRMMPPNLSPTSSPILSYFMGQSPTKSTTPGTFPFSRKFGAAPPVFEGQLMSLQFILVFLTATMHYRRRA